VTPFRQLFSEIYGDVAVLLLLAGIAVIAGLGYRRVASALLVSLAIAFIAAVVGGIAAFFAAIPFVGRGEGAGIAWFLFSAFGAGLCAALAFFVSVGYVIVRRERFRERGPRHWGFHVIAAVLVLLSGMSAASRIPALRTGGSLTGQLQVGGGSLYGQEAEEELRRRGRDAVPELIASINRADQAALQEFESGLTQGVQGELRLLGEIGGPEAIAELRRWLHRDIAADVRAAAAGGLGMAGDTESAPDIARLLENRSYEWRKCHWELIRALGMLNAANEVDHLRSALTFTPDEEGTSFQITLLYEAVPILAKLDTPESWQIIRDVRTAGSGARREAVDRILMDQGLTIPNPAPSTQ
jgi:hypothetical protein